MAPFKFQVLGYTSYQRKFDGDALHTKFHANEYIHGGSWYDWCMIQFRQNDIPASQSMSPAKIIGFIKYESRGIPTPYLIQEEGVTLDVCNCPYCITMVDNGYIGERIFTNILAW